MKSWTTEQKTWVIVVCDLFEQMFGSDFLSYHYDKVHGTKVDDKQTSRLLEYCHEHWEMHYPIDSPEPQDDSKHLCHPRANLSATDLQQLLQKQKPPTAKCTEPANSDSSESIVSNNSSPKLISAVIQTKECSSLSQPTELQEDTNQVYHPSPNLDKRPAKLVSEHPTPKQTKSCNNTDSTSVNCHPSPKAGNTVVIPNESDSTTSQQSILQVAMAKAKTRAAVAALHSLIPPIASRSLSLLEPVYGKQLFSDPFSLAEHPCERDIQKANNVLCDERKAGKKPRGIEIIGIGKFNDNALSILQRFFGIADTYRKVSAEADWLTQMKCSPQDLAQLQDALWHHPASQPILKHGKKMLDATSFSDLVEERYVDSFIIDIGIGKFLDESRENGKNITVYFPSELNEWM